MCAQQTATSSALWNTMLSAKKIVLLAHLKPDPDTLGACAALARVLNTHKISTQIVYPKSFADTVPFKIPNISVDSHTGTPDLLISCDVANLERLYWHKDFDNVPLIVIDHHVGNSIKGTYRLVDETASSTCEMVHQLLRDNNQEIDATTAEMLLFGMLCDTLSFRTPNTTPVALQSASELIACGANLGTLQRAMLPATSPNTLKLWGALLHSGQSNADGTAFWCVCTQEMFHEYSVDETAVSHFISMLSQSTTIETTAFFYEQADGTSKASLRAKTRNIREIASTFGGGGHKLASGITSNLPLAELVASVTARL